MNIQSTSTPPLTPLYRTKLLISHQNSTPYWHTTPLIKISLHSQSTRPLRTILTVILILSRQKDLEWAHKSRSTIFYSNYNHSRPYPRNELFKAPIIHRCIMWRTCTRPPTSQLRSPRMLATQRNYTSHTQVNYRCAAATQHFPLSATEV